MVERDEFNRATIRKLRTELARLQEKEFSSAASAISANPMKRVVLNVGGSKYTTTVDTFARGTYLSNDDWRNHTYISQNPTRNWRIWWALLALTRRCSLTETAPCLRTFSTICAMEQLAA